MDSAQVLLGCAGLCLTAIGLYTGYRKGKREEQKKREEEQKMEQKEKEKEQKMEQKEKEKEQKEKEKECIDYGKESEAIKLGLEYLKRGVDNIQVDIQGLNRTVIDHAERIRGAEESTKSAHHRIDEVVDRLNKSEKLKDKSF